MLYHICQMQFLFRGNFVLFVNFLDWFLVQVQLRAWIVTIILFQGLKLWVNWALWRFFRYASVLFGWLCILRFRCHLFSVYAFEMRFGPEVTVLCCHFGENVMHILDGGQRLFWSLLDCCTYLRWWGPCHLCLIIVFDSGVAFFVLEKRNFRHQTQFLVQPRLLWRLTQMQHIQLDFLLFDLFWRSNHLILSKDLLAQLTLAFRVPLGHFTRWSRSQIFQVLFVSFILIQQILLYLLHLTWIQMSLSIPNLGQRLLYVLIYDLLGHSTPK